MSVKIEVHQDKTVDTGPVFKVDTRVTFSQGIAREIFVFNTESQEFEHVATVWDMDNLPDNLNDAGANGYEYYRKDQAIVGYASQETAEEFAVYTLSRIQYLAQQYELKSDVFEGSGDYIYTGAS